MGRICLVVTKDQMRTPDEEYEYLTITLNSLGNFFAWDVHPNKIRATEIRRQRLSKRLLDLVASDEFQDLNDWKYN